jgi:hypothetical protein
MKHQEHFIRITLIGLLFFSVTNYSQNHSLKKEEHKQSLLEKYSSYLNEEYEILTLRTENAQHFDINDSFYIAKIFSSPITAFKNENSFYKVEADTTLTLNPPTSGMVFKDGGGNITKFDNTLHIQNTSAMGCEFGYRSWVKYDISSMPNSANVFEIQQFIYCTELLEEFFDYLEYNIVRVDYDPVTATPDDLWTDIFEGAMYVYNEWVTNPPAWEWCTLSSPAPYDFTIALNNEDWFALGYMVKCDEDDSDFRAIFDGYLDTYPPYIIVRYNIVNSVEVIESELNSFTLYQNYPNPFNPSTKINFSLPSSSYAALEIYNELGEKVGDLLNRELTNGNYEVEWDASGLPSGIYFYQLRTNEFVETKKMILMK